MAVQLEIRASKLIILSPLVGLAFGRWGAYIGIPGTPVFLNDILMLSGCVLLFVSRLGGRQKSATTRFDRRLLFASVLILAILTLGALRSTSLDLLSVRDAVPFIYLAATPIFALAVANLGSHTVLRWLANASIIHTLWFTPSALDLLEPFNVPILAGVPLFTTRSDFDQLICGLAIALILRDRRFVFWQKCVLLTIGLTGFLASGSRAGLLAGTVVVLVALFFGWRLATNRTKFLSVVVALFTTPIVVLSAVRLISDPPEWASGLLRLLPNDSAEYQSGQNTWNARLEAWRLVWQFVTETKEGFLYGLGFGSNAVFESGAILHLSGDPSVRAAHNFIVTWFSMIGLTGIIIFILWNIVIFGIGLYCFARKPSWQLSIGLSMMIGIYVCGAAGVILESPFGYILISLAAAMCVAPKVQRSANQPQLATRP